jgi:glycosyltransferase involved in cell wall biosynthesis
VLQLGEPFAHFVGRMAGACGFSVLINTLNEADKIRTCVESVRWADEVIVVDMESDDGTADLARQMGCKVFNHKRMGYVEPARQFGVQQASYDWVLILDADETVSEATSVALREIAKAEKVSGVKLPRKNHWKGRFLNCCGWYPDRQLRFLRKTHSSFPTLIHHQPEVHGEIVSLPADGECFLIHDAVVSWASRLEKLARYGKFSADAMKQKGRSIGVLGIFLRTTTAFIVNYILKGGVLQGWLGLFLSMERACATFMKYTCLWEMRSNDKNA